MPKPIRGNHTHIIEAERGYCTEHLGGGKHCLQPAVADVHETGPLDGLKCAQHVKGIPLRYITWLDENAELRERLARHEEIRFGAAREIAEEL